MKNTAMLAAKKIILLTIIFSLNISCTTSPEKISKDLEIARLQKTAIDKGFLGQHPSVYYKHAFQSFNEGKRDEAIFWLYVGKLRWGFHLAANPEQDISGDPALFASFNYSFGKPINYYAGKNPDNLVEILEAVLVWDKITANRFTSKEKYAKQYETVRQGIIDLKKQIALKRQEILDRYKMPKDWPPLKKMSSLSEINGVYLEGKDFMLGPCLDLQDHLPFRHTDYYRLTVVNPKTLLVTAFDDKQTYVKYILDVQFVNGSATFYKSESSDFDKTKSEGKTYLHLNELNELVIERHSIIHYQKPDNYSEEYTYWNRYRKKKQ